jgi:hypothetical protein
MFSLPDERQAVHHLLREPAKGPGVIEEALADVTLSGENRK